MMDIARDQLPGVIAQSRCVGVIFTPDDRAPFGRVSQGEMVYLRCPPAGPCAAARVERVDEFDALVPSQARTILDTFGPRLISSPTHADPSNARFATVVWLADVRPVLDASCVPAALAEPSHRADAWRTVDGPAAMPTPTARRVA